jgi:hypothetical protein
MYTFHETEVKQESLSLLANVIVSDGLPVFRLPTQPHIRQPFRVYPRNRMPETSEMLFQVMGSPAQHSLCIGILLGIEMLFRLHGTFVSCRDSWWAAANGTFFYGLHVCW